jgi:hypothetical protein
MIYFIKVAVIWLSLDVLILASVWYATSTVQPLFPGWWKAVVCDHTSESIDI